VREPFHVRGAAADAFEAARFGGRLRHVEVAFESPMRGPLVLGDGRFTGLGIMRPVRNFLRGCMYLPFTGQWLRLSHVRLPLRPRYAEP
jgi:hypothetical protein